MLSKQIQRNSLPCFLFRSFSTSCQSPCSNSGSQSTSKLLSNLFKTGRVLDAEKLFDKIPHRNIVSWSIVIHGYAINGYHQKSTKSFSQMQKFGLAPNSFAFVGVLVNAAGACDLVLAKSVHGLVVKSGLQSDSVVATAMLDSYAKCGNVSDSYRVFEELEDPGLVSCNAIVAGFINNGLCGEGVMLFKKFRLFGLVPNAVTLLTLVRGCVALQLRMLCESIHALVVKLGFCSDMSVGNSVLGMYSGLVDFSAATKYFNEMGCKDVISWTTMMGLLVDLEYASDALKLFCQMVDSRINLDALAIMHIVSACAILGDLKRGRQVHAQAVICGFQSELPLVNSIIKMYSMCGDLDSSRTVFDQTNEKTLVSWTAMISGYVQNGCPKEALDLVVKARLGQNSLFDSVMLVSAVTASGELAALELCQQFHCYSFKAAFSQYRSVQNGLIAAYSKCGNVDLAHNVFKEMGCIRDVVSWNAIISGYGINGKGETALALYHKMRKVGEDPDSATYLCVLNGCRHAGLINDGLILFNEMVEDCKVRPTQEHIGCTIDLLVRAGCFSDTESATTDKLLENMDPNAWKNLINGCALHNNLRLAEAVAKKLTDLDLGESGQTVLLSNLYASVGRFQDAETLRLSMQNKGFIKNPGISFLKGVSYGCG